MAQETSAHERRGRADVEQYARHPPSLPMLELGSHDELGRASRALRNALLALRVPPGVLGAMGALAPGRRASAAWSRLTASHAYWTGVRRAADRETYRRLRRGVLILMYHGIGAPGEPPSRYVVPAARFRRQMEWLKRRRYNVIALEELLRARAAYRLAPPKSVVITLDDGYLDNLTRAKPILEQLGLPATIFLVSAGGEANGWSTTPGVAGRPLMSLDGAREACDALLSFGAHSMTHPKLPQVSPEEARREIEGSKRELEAALAVPVTTFAYPYGEVDADVRDAVVAAGFAAACSTRPGRNRPADDDFALRRVEVYGTDRLARFAATLAVGELPRRRHRS
ncbi:MAG TPA: polysaccharide deacetylase family protein [Gaiellaceae bacterium]|nr:polysaccharide deacetylase family protein [Gaiellaceae bacterium]